MQADSRDLTCRLLTMQCFIDRIRQHSGYVGYKHGIRR